MIKNEKANNIKKLEINHLKICSCKNHHINCLTGKEWIRNQVAIWKLYYEKRIVRDKDIHPASYPISLPKRCIELLNWYQVFVTDIKDKYFLSGWIKVSDLFSSIQTEEDENSLLSSI